MTPIHKHTWMDIQPHKIKRDFKGVSIDFRFNLQIPFSIHDIVKGRYQHTYLDNTYWQKHQIHTIESLIRVALHYFTD